MMVMILCLNSLNGENQPGTVIKTTKTLAKRTTKANGKKNDKNYLLKEKENKRPTGITTRRIGTTIKRMTGPPK